MARDRDLKDIVSRVSSEVLGEMEENRFHIQDFEDHVERLGGGKAGAAAWSITYDTSSSKLTPGPGPGLPGGSVGPAAWSISYTTGSSSVSQSASRSKS